MSQTLYTSSWPGGPSLRITLREDGIMFVVADGVTRPEDIAHFADDIYEIYRAHAPVLHLLEIRNFRAANVSAPWAMASVLKRHRGLIRRSAVLGIAPHIQFMAQTVVTLSGRTNVRFFRAADTATEWLLSEETPP